MNDKKNLSSGFEQTVSIQYLETVDALIAEYEGTVYTDCSDLERSDWYGNPLLRKAVLSTSDGLLFEREGAYIQVTGSPPVAKMYSSDSSELRGEPLGRVNLQGITIDEVVKSYK